MDDLVTLSHHQGHGSQRFPVCNLERNVALHITRGLEVNALCPRFSILVPLAAMMQAPRCDLGGGRTGTSRGLLRGSTVTAAPRSIVILPVLLLSSTLLPFIPSPATMFVASSLSLAHWHMQRGRSDGVTRGGAVAAVVIPRVTAKQHNPDAATVRATGL